MNTLLSFPLQDNLSASKKKALAFGITLMGLVLCQVYRSNTGVLSFEIPLAIVSMIALFFGTRIAIGCYGLSIFVIAAIYLTPALAMDNFIDQEKNGFAIFLLVAPVLVWILDWFRREIKSAVASEQRFHDLVDHLDNAIAWEADPRNLDFLFVSKKCEELLGYTKSEWINMGQDLWKKIVPEEDQHKLRLLMHNARFGHITDDRCEHRFITKNGVVRWFQTGFHVHQPNCPSARLYGLSVEMTPLKESERKLAEGEAEFKAIFDLAATGMAQCDPISGHFLRVNARLCEFFGYSDEELLTKTILELIHPDDRKKDLDKFREMMQGERPIFKSERRYIRKDGRIIWGAVSAAVTLRSQSGEPLKTIAIFHDLSEQKNSEEELKRARAASEQANQAKTNFLANMSHEIRTPIGVIQGYAELLNEADELTPEEHDMVNSIARNTHQLTEIIGEILDVSKIEADKVEIEILRFPLDELIEDVKAVLGFKAQQKNIEFRFTVVGPKPKYIISDPTRLKQILLNLGGNAIKFTNQGYVEIVFECLQQDMYKETSQCFKINVRDTGIGMTEKEQSKLFTPFTQADASTTRKFGGTGLGLFISKNLAKALHGQLELTKSAPGEGSCFSVTFTPSYTNVKDHPSMSRYRSSKPSGRLNQFKILLVEDAIDNQILLRKILTREGAVVDVASNGSEGCKKALWTPYDVVLMDIQMPILDGWEAVNLLRSRCYEKPIVALTAHAFREERERSMQSGFNDYLTKPVDRELMIHTLQRLVDKPPAQPESPPQLRVAPPFDSEQRHFSSGSA